MTEKNVFLTDDITIADHNQNDFERYSYTPDYYAFLDHCANYSDWHDDVKKEAEARAEAFIKLDEPETAQEFYDGVTDYIADYPEAFDDWRDSADESEQVPMMYALRYFPDFIDFSEADRHKVSGSITLLYDNEREAWAIGMTGGGMDLAPHLLDTFIALGKGVPSELAGSIRRNYGANLSSDKHAQNCDLLAKAYKEKGEQYLYKCIELKGENVDDSPLKRHITAIKKTK